MPSGSPSTFHQVIHASVALAGQHCCRVLHQSKCAPMLCANTVVEVLGGFGAGGTAALLALPSTRLAGLLCLGTSQQECRPNGFETPRPQQRESELCGVAWVAIRLCEKCHGAGVDDDDHGEDDDGDDGMKMLSMKLRIMTMRKRGS